MATGEPDRCARCCAPKRGNDGESQSNCCVRCWAPCALCFEPVKKSCAPDAFDFLVDVGTWKEAFGKPSWLARCLPPVAFFVLRVLLAGFWIGVFIWRQVDGAKKADGSYDGEWWAYLTNWTLTFEMIYLFFAALSTGMAIFGHQLPDGKGKATPWFASVTWALQGTALLMSFLVMLLYWALDYDPDVDVIDAGNVIVHVVNFIVMLIDFAISRQPFHLAHIFMPVIYAVVYLVFNIIYWKATGTVLYNVLDWSNPSKAGTIAGLILLVALPLFWVFFYLLFLWRRCCRVSADGPDDAPKADSA